jgi:hypothetical protein
MENVRIIKEKEKKKNIIPFMSTTVVMELLSHMLDDISSRSFNSCLKACQALYYHCGDEQSFNLLPLPEVQISKEYFDIENNESIKTQKAVGQILYQICHTPTLDTINANIDNLKRIRSFICEAESTLQDEMLNFIKSVDPFATDWKLFATNDKKRREYLDYVNSEEFERITATAMLRAVTMDLIKKSYIEEKQVQYLITAKNISAYVESYKVSLEFRKMFWEFFAHSNFNLTKKARTNFIWDELILHFVGKKVLNQDILLVTSDIKMKEAAKHIDKDSLVMTYEEYLKYLDE